MEEFIKLDQITEPDKRSGLFASINEKTGEVRKMSLIDVYHSVSQIELAEAIPDSIRSQFNIAKNLAVYSWFSYPFHQIAEMKAFSTVEDALKCRLRKDKCSFRGLLKKAIKQGLIRDSGFSHIPVSKNPESIEYSRELPETMSELRNNLAHGGTTLHPDSAPTLKICSEVINQLYAVPSGE